MATPRARIFGTTVRWKTLSGIREKTAAVMLPPTRTRLTP